MFSNGYVDRFHHGHVTINNENFQRNISCIVTLSGEIGKIPLGLTCSALLNTLFFYKNKVYKNIEPQIQ